MPINHYLHRLKLYSVAPAKWSLTTAISLSVSWLITRRSILQAEIFLSSCYSRLSCYSYLHHHDPMHWSSRLSQEPEAAPSSHHPP